MKKIRVKTVVYDRTTMEYVSRTTEREISDQLAEAIQKEFSEDHKSITSYGHGNNDPEVASLRTPLHNQKRYRMDCQFAVVDTDPMKAGDTDDVQYLCGWRGC